MARGGSKDRAERQARRQQRKRAQSSAPPDSAPQSDTRASIVPPPLPTPEDATAIRERPPVAPPEEPDLELDDAFFHSESSRQLDGADFDSWDIDEPRDNPELSPQQSERRRLLRRQVLALMVVLTLFTLAVLVARLPR